MKNVFTILSIALAGITINASGQSYQYDAAGRLTAVVYPGGKAVRYDYTNRDNLSAMTPFFAPDAPRAVLVVRLSNFEAQVTWEHSGDAQGFEVEKRVAGAVDWVPVSESGFAADARSANVELTSGEIASYRVIATGIPPITSSPSASAQLISPNGLVVTTLLDENDHALNRGEGDSLRELIELAVPGDVIRFATGEGSFSLFGDFIKLNGTELVLNKDVTIDASDYRRGIVLDAGELSRIFRITEGATVTLKGLMITRGFADNGGALINEGGTVHLLECDLIRNTASAQGGAIFNALGTVEVVKGNFDGNRAGAGGAIANNPTCELMVSFSTFEEGEAGQGGGIHNNRGTAEIRSSIFVENFGSAIGGGIYNEAGLMLVENCTVYGNASGVSVGAGISNSFQTGFDTNLVLRHCTIAENIGGGVHNPTGAVLQLDNTILANNVDLNNSPSDLFGDYTAIGANLVRTHTGSRLGGPAPLTVDPLLEPLAFYGGVTLTMPPLVGSPVIDAGVETANTPSGDQKSAFRPHGAAPDIGSVESRLSSDTDLLWMTTTAGTITPTFRSIGLDYMATVHGTVATAAVRPAGSHFGQTIEVRINDGSFSTVSSKAASAALDLVAGENTIEVRVTAQNGTTNKTYTLIVIRGAPVESDASLASLTTSSGSLSPVFDSDQHSYNTVVSGSTTSTTVTATPEATGATMAVRSNLGAYAPLTAGTASPPLPLNVGANAIDIRVTAKDGTTTSSTSLVVTREPASTANAYLAGLSTSAGALSPTFSRGMSLYRVTTTDEVTSATVTATAAQTGATLKLRANGGSSAALTSGAASGAIALNAGENVVQVEVTAQDGTTTNPYILIITRVIDGLAAASGSGNNASKDAAISADCLFVAFSSRATNLVTGDNNNKEDVFVLDRLAGTIERVSVANNGTEGNFDSSRPSISADGLFVTFQSEANNLVPNDTNGDIDRSAGKDIFVYDRDNDTIERISLTDSGGESNQASEAASISGDGRYVAFASGANNLVSGYANGEVNVYIHDREETVAADAIKGISVPFGNYTANLNSLNPAMSDDGNYVAFEFSVDKSVGSTPGYQYRDIYLYNRVTQGVKRITGTEIGLDADQTQSAAPSISADGRYVVFQSNLENLDFYDTNSAGDVFIYDRTDGSIRRVSSNGSEGGENNKESTNPSISGDGRYVAFESQASNLVESDTNGSTDVFLKDLHTGAMTLVSTNEAGEQGDSDSFRPSVSFDGRCVAFHSNATNLRSNDTNGKSDLFVAYTEKLDPSSVADLVSLASNLGAVRTGGGSYDSQIVPGVEVAFLRPVVADPLASVETRVNSGEFTPLPSDGIASLQLEAGDNTIEIKVTAANGTTTKTTIISLTRILPSSNADLVSLVPSAGALSPALGANTSFYSVVVPNTTPSMTVRPIAEDGNAMVTVNGVAVASGDASAGISLDVGSNSIITQVVAEDGATTRTYALAVTREFKATDLFDLSPSFGFIEPGFAPATTSYSMTVPNFVSELGFIPTVAVEGATVTVNGVAVESGSSSSQISLAVGENTVTTVVTAPGGGATETYSVTVTRAEEPVVDLTSRLVNLSVRTTLAEAQILIVGFVMEGGEKEVLVRAAGPALNGFGLSGLPDPRLELYKDQDLVTENEDWPSSLAVNFSALGSFAFDPGSLDAALLRSLSGPHTALAKGVGTGVVLVEAYDAGNGTDQRLVNLSARNLVSTGPNVLIAGFVIEGTGTKTLVIRGIGPKLGEFGVKGFLADPLIEVYDVDNNKIAENDDWDASLTDTFSALGAFALTSGSPDAALITVLPAGTSYTVVLKGADGGNGEALVEVYEVE